MKASFTLGPAEKAIHIVALIASVAWIMYPAIVRADNSSQHSGEQALVFEVKNLPTQNSDKDQTPVNPPSSITLDQLTQSDPLVNNLRDYLQKHNSPLAEYADQIVKQPQWQRALAISYQESHFGIYCHSNNCSGIGGSPASKSWRKYPTKLDWFKDMSALMEKPMYKERFTNCRTMNGVYNAGSRTWLYSCEKKSAELIALTQASEQQRLALVNNNLTFAIATSELSLK